jgi:CRP-like cAMP-binding protein
MLIQSHKRPVVKNTILGNLPLADFAHIRPYLHHITFKERAVLQDHRKPVEYVNFIESGIISLRTVAAGSLLEIAMVGWNGMVGVSVPLGVEASVHQSIVLIPGSALSIRADDLRRLMVERPQIREHLFRHVQALLIHSAQIALCGIRHQPEQRLASWLCLACDAIEGNVVPVTHDYLSAMLGLRRAGVTETLIRFEDQGVITKARGMLQVRDRSLLNQRTCGCYATIAHAYRTIEHQSATYPH